MTGRSELPIAHVDDVVVADAKARAELLEPVFYPACGGANDGVDFAVDSL